MNLQSLAFDVYQTALITGIKLNAFLECLTDEQREAYHKSVDEQTAAMTEKLKDKVNTEEVLEVLRSINTISNK